ncbi:MAG: tetratricopeptide repeat protein [Thermoguttaceae bacterium]
MLKPIRFVLPAVLLAVTIAARPSFAAEAAGQADLDKASETRLNASADLGEVIGLLESALKKGLDATNTEFANRLLTSTLIERARETTKQISVENLSERRKSAVADLERAVKLDPKQPQAYLLLAELNILPGGAGLKEVLALLDKAIQSGGEDSETKVKALVLRAKIEDQAGKKLADFDEAVRLAPDDAAVVRDRGLALADMDKPERALNDLNRAIELEPGNVPTYEAKAIVLARLKKFDEALAAIDKACQLDPGSIAPLVQKMRIHAQQRKFDAAIDDLNKAWAISPGNVGLLLLRAELYREKGDKRKALADLDEAAKLKPDLPEIIRTKAMLLAQDERFDEAIALLEKLAKRDPKDVPTLLQLSVLYGAKKDWAKAIETDRRVLVLDPTEWQALRGLGDAMLNTGRHAEAIAFFEKAIKLEPSDDGILNNLAWVLATSPDAKLRNGPRAIQLATKACKLTEYKIPHILSTLAAAYAESGDFKNALKWSTTAVEIAERETDKSKDGDKETREALKKELENYKAKNPTRELMSEGKGEQKKP